MFFCPLWGPETSHPPLVLIFTISVQLLTFNFLDFYILSNTAHCWRLLLPRASLNLLSCWRSRSTVMITSTSWRPSRKLLFCSTKVSFFCSFSCVWLRFPSSRLCLFYSGKLRVNDARWPEIIAKSLSWLMFATCQTTFVKHLRMRLCCWGCVE